MYTWNTVADTCMLTRLCQSVQIKIRGDFVAKNRRGMLIKNTNDRAVNIEMKTREISLNPGEEKFITAEEVRDDQLRAKLQVRAVSIVRPSTEAEEVALMKEIEALTSQQDEVGEGDTADSSDSMLS